MKEEEKKIYKTSYHLNLTETVPLNRYHEAIDFLKAQVQEQMAADGIQLSTDGEFDVTLEVNVYTKMSTPIDK